MSDYDTRRATRYLPHVVVATLAVAVLPVAIVWWLRSRGAIASPWLGVVLALGLSLAASFVGRAYWKRRRGPRDLLFGELLVWGWLRRVRMERQLARSMKLLRADEPLGAEIESPGHRFRILSQLVVALEAQDTYTDGHSRRVAAHAVMVARRMGLSAEEVARVRAAAAVHDIGKVRVPRDVLDKPGRLTGAELELVKAHADAGAEIVACLGDPELTATVRHHHEHFDGTGYPCGLAYEQIPLGARIIAVADAFDALTSVRPYRPAAPHKQALEALAAASGTQLDPVAVRAFLRCYSGNKAIVFWTLLTVSPQRLIAWLGDKRPAPRNASLGSTSTTIAVLTAIGVAALSTPLGSRSGAYQLRELNGATTGAIATVLPNTILAPTSHHTLYRPRFASAPPRQRAAQSSGRMYASRGSADRGLVGLRATHSGALAGGPGSQPRGGSRGQRGASLGGGPPGGSAGPQRGTSGGGPNGGATTPPVGTSGGGPSGGANGGSPTGGPTSGPPRGSASGSGNGSTGSSGNGSAGASGNGSAGASGNGSAGGSSGTSGGGSGATGTRAPITKDQCKTGGYSQYGFANQGQCVASTERGTR